MSESSGSVNFMLSSIIAKHPSTLAKHRNLLVPLIGVGSPMQISPGLISTPSILGKNNSPVILSPYILPVCSHHLITEKRRSLHTNQYDAILNILNLGMNS